LHNLASIIANPGKYKGVTSGGTVHFDELGFKRYLRDIAAGRDNTAMDRTFLMKQQKNLGITSSFLKQARRASADYGRTSAGERTGLSARMVNSQRQDGKFRSDISRQYMGTVADKKLVPQIKKACHYGLKQQAHLQAVLLLDVLDSSTKKSLFSYKYLQARIDLHT
jgi:hypothetical protein